MLKLSRPWDSQPQDAVGVDWGNPLLHGLVSAYLPLGASSINLLRNSPSSWLASTNVSAGVSLLGPGWIFTQSNTTSLKLDADTSRTSTTTRLHVVVPRSMTFEHPLSNTNSVFGSGAGGLLIRINPGGSSVGWLRSQYSGIQTFTDASFVAGAPTCIVGTHTPGEAKVFVDGRKLTAGGYSTPASLSITGLWLGVESSTNGGQKSFDGSYHLYMDWGRVLSDAECIEISANPWQLFAPRSIWVPVSAGGGPTYTLTAAAGAFTLTGNAAALTTQRKITAGAGSFALTGNAAALSAQRKLTAEAGAYTLTGAVAGLTAQRKLAAGVGAYTLTGNDATLTYTPVGGPTYTLTAAAGSFALTGSDAGLTAARKLTAGAGAYALSGNDATLTYTPRTLVLTAEAGSFSLTGADATLTFSGYVAPVRHAGGFKRVQGPRKGYIIKGNRYWLTEDELMVLVAQELADISKRDIKQVTAGKPKPISKKVWDLIKPMERLEALTQPDQYDEDDDLEVLMLFL